MDATRRFSNRVSDYVKFRPTYPESVFSALAARLSPELPRVAADIGSGTGIFSRGLLAHGFEVFGVEPNPEMRAAAEQAFASEPRFCSGDGRAEATRLANGSVALVVAAQAFHWFDPALCREEWQRILLSDGIAGVVWNQRRLDSPFMLAYEALMQQLKEYVEVRQQRREHGAVEALFGGASFETLEYCNQQTFDWEGLRGRVLSSSYVPKPSEPGHDELMRELRHCYDAQQRSGYVQFDFVTRLHVGRL